MNPDIARETLVHGLRYTDKYVWVYTEGNKFLLPPSDPNGASIEWHNAIRGAKEEVLGTSQPPPAPSPSPPGITYFTADPSGIQVGQSFTLSWSVQNADSIWIDQGVGNVGPIGTRTLSPSSTTTYTLTATNSGGSATATATISVSAVPTPAPVVTTFAAQPSSIQLGQSSTLSWSVQNADSISINQGVGTVGPIGNRTLSPTGTTTYTLTAIGPGGSTTATASISVTQPPPSGTGSVTPSSGTGDRQAFTFTFKTGNGSAVTGASILISEGTQRQNSCWVHYDPTTNLIFLADDDLSPWFSATFGQSGSIQNSQCLVLLGGSSVVKAGSELTLKFSYWFLDSGPKDVYLRTAGVGYDSGYILTGVWNVP